MRADDGNGYVVKFANNPQGRWVLPNEYLATRLAAMIGLPVPEMALVHVPEALIRSNAALRMPLGGFALMCSSGIQFGSRLCGDPEDSVLFDLLPFPAYSLVRNADAILGAYVFDKWVGNIDRRQFVFVRSSRSRGICAFLIDHGLCFGGSNWTFRDAPRDGLAAYDFWYKRVHSWDAFEPWIRRIEAMKSRKIERIADGLPASWIPDPAGLDSLLATLDTRRARLRELISEALTAFDSPFVNWRGAKPCRSIRVVRPQDNVRFGAGTWAWAAQ